MKFLLRLMRFLNPESAHKFALDALRRTDRLPFRLNRSFNDKRLNVEAFGETLSSPVGLAAGFDKDGQVFDPMLGLGFAFVEVGTVTPKAQTGNPQPRLFRLPEEEAVINRMGFNNAGHDQLLSRLADRKRPRPGAIGVNIGTNKDSVDRTRDYVLGVERFARRSAYLTVNISSPNTPGLRDLHEREALDELLDRITNARDGVSGLAGGPAAILLKIAPDLTDEGLKDIVETVKKHAVDGLIVSNTTLSRAGVEDHFHGQEAGGLSGTPLFDRSTALLARVRQLVGPDTLLVGVGGINSAATAWRKIVAGADLIQIYTGLTYHGPALIPDIKAGLIKRLNDRNFKTIRDARDIETDRWAELWPYFAETEPEPEKSA